MFSNDSKVYRHEILNFVMLQAREIYKQIAYTSLKYLGGKSYSSFSILTLRLAQAFWSELEVVGH
jgi:hypothetical protein